MIITKYFEGLTREENGRYVYQGDLVYEDSIKVWLDAELYVTGCIKAGLGITAGLGIEAGEGIMAGWGIEAGWGITAGEGIEAGWGIMAGEGIEAGTSLRAGKRIFAGVNVFNNSDTCYKEIRCKELLGGEICYGELVLVKEGEDE